MFAPLVIGKKYLKLCPKHANYRRKSQRNHTTEERLYLHFTTNVCFQFIMLLLRQLEQVKSGSAKKDKSFKAGFH